jgi:carboxymethylenebutenolidase
MNLQKGVAAPTLNERDYLALPSVGQGSAVLVLHAWWGLNDTIRAVCDRLAQAGFTALAPDLYRGEVAATITEAERLSQAVTAEQVKADIGAAVNYLCQQDGRDGRQLAVIGFSFGAYFALELAVDDPERVRAVVLYYGTGRDDHAGSQAAYLGHFAEQDEYEPTEFVDGLEASLREAGRPVTLHRYPGVGHWFCEPDRPNAYSREAAELAWTRTIAFLKESGS